MSNECRHGLILYNKPHPDWEADGVVYAWVGERDDVDYFEELAARLIDATRFILCTIPAYSRNLALGDHVEAHQHRNLGLLIKERIVDSGHIAYRIWLGDLPGHAADDTARHVRRKSKAMGCSMQRPTSHLIAIDAPNLPTSVKLVSWMKAGEWEGRWVWEAAND
jgi:hypothetical protein